MGRHRGCLRSDHGGGDNWFLFNHPSDNEQRGIREVTYSKSARNSHSLLKMSGMLLVFILASGLGGAEQERGTFSALGSWNTLAPSRTSATPVRVFLPRGDNLQWMNFWVTLGAGFFEEEGLEIELVVGGGTGSFLRGAADVAVMPRPSFLSEVGKGQPIVAFANLLANDPINLLVSGELAEARGISDELPLVDRLKAMRGLRVGIAPGPPPRLRILMESVGLDPDHDIEMVTVRGPEQNRALDEGRVDALYSHTPYLERALVDQGAVMVVNQSAGEVPGLSNRQIHMLVTTQDYLEANPDLVGAMVRAVYRGQQLIHSHRQATIDAIHASGVTLQAPQGLRTLVEIYEPAIPLTPEVSITGALRELDLFPGHQACPDLSGVDMSAHIDNRFARELATGNE